MIGIYSLYWEIPDKIYIGQSSNITYRYEQHKYKFIKGTANYKMQEMYNLYGFPTLNVLEQCSVAELDVLEVHWINEFNSINEGLNIAKGGKCAVGTLNFSSTYSKFKLLKVFSRLYLTNNSCLDISKEMGVHIGTVSAIVQGIRHVWLEEEYPDEYSRMVERRMYIPKRSKYPSLIDSKGVIHNILNIKEFCESNKELAIRQDRLGQVLSGKINMHKGFKLLDPKSTKIITNTRDTLLGPNNEEYVGISNISEFCRNNVYLKDIPQARKGLSRIFNKERESYLGFKLK